MSRLNIYTDNYGYEYGETIVVKNGTGEPNTGTIYLSSQQALDLLLWLEQQKANLEAWAKYEADRWEK